MKASVFLLLGGCLASWPAHAQRPTVPVVRHGLPLDSFRLSDPFILADAKTHTYYMTGTGGLLWRSPDLKTWDGPYQVAQTDSTSWMGPRPLIWAAELHPYKGKYYYFATFTNRAVRIEGLEKNKNKAYTKMIMYLAKMLDR